MLRKFLAKLAVVTLFTIAGLAHAAELPRAMLEISSGTGTHQFQVEIAATGDDRRTGLMFRQTLGQNEGMLFVYQSAGLIAMWMKDTYIPLDMLFIDRSGVVVKIAENTVPHSLTPISSDYPVTMVLELPGGSAERFGLRTGDQIRYQALQ